MVKTSIFAVAAVYALAICWPASAADNTTSMTSSSSSASSSTSKRPLVQTTDAGSAVYTAPAAFPTSEFPSMDFMPTGQEAEPRPHITRVGGGDFSDSLVNPMSLPSAAPSTEAVYPEPSPSYTALASSNSFQDEAMKNLTAIIEDQSMSSCDRCRSALRLGQRLAWAKPSAMPGLMTDLCKKYKYESRPTVDLGCELTFGPAQWGSVYAQVLSYANFSEGSTTIDYMCASAIKGGSCDFPQMKVLSSDFLNDWFKGKPTPPAEVVSRSKKVGPKRDTPLRVFHGSDFHVDPRYLLGSEGSCNSGQCCRADSYNTTLWSQTQFAPGSLPKANISHPADYWGYYQCDSPWSLVAAGMEGISGLQKEAPLDLALYTGDLTTHDSDAHISQDLVKYSEQSLYDMFHRHLGNTTMVVALGNHDSSPADLAAPSSLPDGRANQLSWDWDNVAALVKSEGWGNDSTAETIRTHYGGYSVSPRQGLRVIALNSDFWYHGNPMTFLNLDDPDQSGTLRWFTDELQAAEDANERVWMVAHVLTGWSGGDGVDNPTNLLYEIVSRYSHTIAAIFFGHTHEDEFQIWYESSNGNSSSVSRKTQDARAIGFIGPSLTPLTNVNPSLRVYDVDPETYEVMDYSQYYTQLQDNESLTKTGPVWHLLYKARETYSNFSATAADGSYAAPVALQNGAWPADAPLNASFWAALTDEMEKRPELVELHQLYQGRNSPRSPQCSTEACQKAKVCYMRSASSNLGRSCPKGYGSVQSN
ncbi:putative acid sphingomyelinase [Malassezia pachydermatis]|uniref:Putative acid sphingomyelinase n=1 Tax=Malassezia pachydermatis TaxID=77020 RepID=A0A0M8MXS1_9BASI|nr:putative acid sphingomyelinase [Malassezia pachydermatis]KOS15701.1 putative acid sphingomyelinase [Malassezia pachydermatis]